MEELTVGLRVPTIARQVRGDSLHWEPQDIGAQAELAGSRVGAMPIVA